MFELYEQVPYEFIYLMACMNVFECREAGVGCVCACVRD